MHLSRFATLHDLDHPLGPYDPEKQAKIRQDCANRIRARFLRREEVRDTCDFHPVNETNIMLECARLKWHSATPGDSNVQKSLAEFSVFSKTNPMVADQVLKLLPREMEAQFKGLLKNKS